MRMIRPVRTGIAAFVTALAGIPFFGPITGLAAVVMGSLAIGTMKTHGQRGLTLAVGGIVLGLIDVLVWVVVLYHYVFSQPVRLGDF